MILSISTMIAVGPTTATGARNLRTAEGLPATPQTIKHFAGNGAPRNLFATDDLAFSGLHLALLRRAG